MRKFNKMAMLMIPLLLTSCGSRKPEYTGNNIVVKPAANIQEGSFKLSAISKPPTKTHMEPKEIVENTPIVSPYAESLSVSKQKIYSEMLGTVIIGGKNYIPSEKMNVDDLKGMLRIIMLDEPRAYALKKQYTYILDSNKNVKEVIFSYSPYLLNKKAKEEYKKLIKLGSSSEDNELKLAYKTFGDLSKTFVRDEVQTKQLLKALSTEEGQDLSPEEEESLYTNHLEKFKEDIKDTIFGAYYLEKPTEEAMTKAFNAGLREHSVSAIAMYGERTSDFKSDNLTVNKFTGYREIEEKVERGVRVTINTSGINSWNMFKVDDSWYHGDIVISRAVDERLKDKGFPEKYYGFGMSDRESAISKLSFYNEDILGVCPMSYDDLASSLRDDRSVAFIENSTTARLSDDLGKMIADKTINRKALIVAFSQVDVFDSFVLSKDMLLSKYFEQKIIDYSEYKTLVVPEIQAVFFFDLK